MQSATQLGFGMTIGGSAMRVFVILAETVGEFGSEWAPVKVADTGKRAKTMAYNLIRKGKAEKVRVLPVDTDGFQFVTIAVPDVPAVTPRKAKSVTSTESNGPAPQKEGKKAKA